MLICLKDNHKRNYTLKGSYKVIINLDKRSDNSLSLISYADEYSKLLKFTSKEKTDMINNLFKSRNFDSLLKKFLSYFGNYVEIIYRLKKII